MNRAVRVAVVASTFVYAAARALHAFGEAFDRQIVMVPDVPTDPDPGWNPDPGLFEDWRGARLESLAAEMDEPIEYRAHEVVNGKCKACGENE